jgi:hypothetical protein
MHEYMERRVTKRGREKRTERENIWKRKKDRKKIILR